MLNQGGKLVKAQYFCMGSQVSPYKLLISWKEEKVITIYSEETGQRLDQVIEVSITNRDVKDTCPLTVIPFEEYIITYVVV